MNSECIPLQDITHTQLKSARQLHIASLVAHIRPAHFISVRDWLLQPQDEIHVEIHAENEQGKMVIVTESAAEKAIVDFLEELRNQPGVLNAALVYHEYLSAQDLQDDLSNEEKAS
jgi:nitrate reductase NapD